MKSHPTAIAFAVIITEIIFCFLIYIGCAFIRRRRRWQQWQQQQRQQQQQHNEQQIRRINSEDTTSNAESVLVFFPYSIAKVLLGKIKVVLRCANCLDEFKDGEDETLRLIPNCRHVFHPLCLVDPCSVKCPCCEAVSTKKDDDEAEAEDEDAVDIDVGDDEVEKVEENCDKMVIRLPEDVMEKIVVHAKLISQTGRPCSPTKFFRKKNCVELGDVV